MDTLLQDLRHALRTLRASPSFSVAAVLTLALGIGAGATVFSAIDTVLLRPLPFPKAERLQLVWTRSEDAPESWLSHPEWMDLRERSSAFSDLAALRDFSFAATGRQEPEQLPALGVSANLFPVLGIRPMLGRAFLPEEDQAGTGHVVLLSHGYWQRAFGGSPSAVGSVISLDGEPHTVVGVLPPRFRLLPPSSVFPRDAAVLVPLEPMLGAGFLRGRDVRHLHVIGRLKPGVTAAQAQADVQGVAAQLRQEHPGVYASPGSGMSAVGYQEHLVRGVRPALLMVFGAVGFLLLLVAVNVANLLLVRHTAQAREMAVRAALGAPRSRLIRLCLFESLLLALLGGMIGVLIAEVGVEVLRAVGPENLPRLEELSVDGRVLGFALLLSVALALGFGIFLALRTPGGGEGYLLRGSSRGVSAGPRQARTRRALVVSQMALAVGLLVGTGLLLKSLARLRGAPTGFEPAHVLTAHISPSSTRYSSGAERSALVAAAEERLGSLPGIRAVGTVTQLPLSGASLGSGFIPEGAAGEEIAADLRGVTPGYFHAMGIRLIRGRGFVDADTRDAPWVAVIDEKFAAKLWPGQDPIGRRFRWKRADEPIEVVGVAAAIKHTGLADAPQETVYRPYAQYSPATPVFFTLRSNTDPQALAAAVRREIQAIDPDQPITEIRSMEERVRDSLSQPRFYTLLLSAFAGVALLLAGLGLYGVIAFGVAQRTREIGIRAALGAERVDVLRLVLAEGLRLWAAGVAGGLVIALTTTRVLEKLLYEVHPADPLVFAAVPLLLGSVALVASYLPARRAARVDPMIALRAE